MDRLVELLSGAAKTRLRNDDDLADRLNSRYTCSILVLFAIVVSTTQYVGEPIECWVPAHFTDNHERYANNMCWISDHYYLPFEKTAVPENVERLGRKHISYYRWVPVFLLLQALMFYLPCIVWRNLNCRSGIDVNRVVEAACTYHNADFGEERDKMMRFMTRQFDCYLSRSKRRPVGFRDTLKKCFSVFCGKRSGSFLIILYLLIKFLYVTNVVGQIFVLGSFLGTDYHLFGIDVLRSIAFGEDWTKLPPQSPRFPRVTMCDFDARRMGNVHKYTVQCVLAINFFNEKIYLFVWFWFILVALISGISLIKWGVTFAMPGHGHIYIRKHLSLADRHVTDADSAHAGAFINRYLRKDGVFVLKIVESNTNAIVATELITSLWDQYRNKRKSNMRLVNEEV